MLRSIQLCCLLLLAVPSSAALPESLSSVPYPNLQHWQHAWPYDVSKAVQLSPKITVKIDAVTSSAVAVKSADSGGDDPLISEIIGRYQTLIRAKSSAAERFRGNISSMPVLSTIMVSVTTDGPTALHLGPNTNESYTIEVKIDASTNEAVAVVAAPTAFGMKHGLETLAQMVKTPDGVICGVSATTPSTVQDQPVWPYRGLMIDTGRHYLKLATIRHAIDGMAALKLNVLHWHILDSSSFPVQSKLFPALSAKGAYSKGSVYSLDDLKAIVAYARSRAVRVVPEIEMPGHGSFSAGMPELSLSSCSDVLDPTKDTTYTFLAQFLSEMATVFTDELVYLGGDEVGFDPKCSWPGTKKCGYHCFDKDPAVAAWMKEKGINATQTLDYFWQQVTD
jgi:hexosaminidase